MEREGKAAGGRVAAAHLELCVVCCVWCVLREGRTHGVSVNSQFVFGNRRFRTI